MWWKTGSVVSALSTWKCVNRCTYHSAVVLKVRLRNQSLCRRQETICQWSGRTSGRLSLPARYLSGGADVGSADEEEIESAGQRLHANTQSQIGERKMAKLDLFCPEKGLFDAYVTLERDKFGNYQALSGTPNRPQRPTTGPFVSTPKSQHALHHSHKPHKRKPRFPNNALCSAVAKPIAANQLPSLLVPNRHHRIGAANSSKTKVQLIVDRFKTSSLFKSGSWLSSPSNPSPFRPLLIPRLFNLPLRASTRSPMSNTKIYTK